MDGEEIDYKIEHIPIDDVDPLTIWSRNPSEAYIKCLADDIAETGLTHLPLVREKNGHRQLVTGHCRRLALKKLGWETFPCRNCGPMDDETAFKIHLSENAVRKDLNPIEEAETLRKIKEELRCPIGELTNKLPKKYESSTIHDRLVLLNLDGPIQREIASGELPATVGVELARCTTKFNRWDEQQQIFKKALKHSLNRDSVRGLVRAVLSDTYATIPAEIKAAMFNDPFVTAEHISILFLRPEDSDKPSRAACCGMWNEDKIRIIDAVGKMRMSPEEMIEYAEDLLEKRDSKKRVPTEQPPQNIQVLFELEEAADKVRRKAGEVLAFPDVAGERSGRIRKCIELLDRACRQLEKMLAAEETPSEEKERADHAGAR